jgi:MFS family permease
MRGRWPGPRWAIAAVFVIHGFVFASWTAHIPHLKAALGLSDHQLGLVLLGAPAGAIASAATLVWLLPKVPARRLLPVALIGYALGGLLIGAAGSPLELSGGLAVWGYFQGSLDATMNTEAVAIETGLDRPIMSSLHGLWSAGSLLGAALGAACVAAGITLDAQLAVISAVVVLATPVLAARLPASHGAAEVPPPVPESGTATGGGRAAPEVGARSRLARGKGSIAWAVAILGVICLADLLCEGAVADWSAVYLRDNLRTSAVVSGLGYATFMTGMLAIRAVGDRLRSRASPRVSVASLAVIATAGMAAALLLANPVATLAGFLCLGLGVGTVFPTAVVAAGRLPGVNAGIAVSIVSACGWIGYVGGPPLIGQLTSFTTLRAALSVIPILTMVIALIAVSSRELNRRM